MAQVDIVGVEIVKNHPSLTGGPGGRLTPPACGSHNWRFVRPVSAQNVHTTSRYRSAKYCPPNSSNTKTCQKKRNNPQIDQKPKKHENR